MDCQKIIAVKKVNVIIDSYSIYNRIKSNSKLIKSLKYNNCNEINMFKSPIEKTDTILDEIPSFSFIKSKEDKINGYQVDYGKGRVSHSYLYYDEEMFKGIGEKIIYNKSSLNQYEFQQVINLMVYKSKNIPLNDEETTIYLTEDSVILKQRYKLRNWSNSIKLIMNLEEIDEYLNLYFKNKSKYFIAPQYSYNQGYWYSTYVEFKVPYLPNNSSIYLEGIQNKFVYGIKSLENMGIEYYSGTNNDTYQNKIYYFNYIIISICGIFDNLGLLMHEKYNLQYDKHKINLKYNNFFNLLPENLKKLIIKYMQFIKLLYSEDLRHSIIHGSGFNGIFHYEASPDNLERMWEVSCIKLPKKIEKILPHLQDKNKEYDPFSFYGKIDNTFSEEGIILIEPYHFAKSIFYKTFEFTNFILKEMGYENQIKIKELKDIKNDYKLFKENTLGL